MTSTLERNCLFTLTFCLVSYLGLFLLRDQCSEIAMAITLTGLMGIGWGLLGILREIVSHPRVRATISWTSLAT